MFLHHNKLIPLIPISAATCEFVILHRCRGVEQPLSMHWHHCHCVLMYQRVVASQLLHYQFHKNVTFDLKIAPCDQGRLNSIVDPPKKQCTEVHTYTNTHRDKTVNVDKIKHIFIVFVQNQCLNIKNML